MIDIVSPFWCRDSISPISWRLTVITVLSVRASISSANTARMFVDIKHLLDCVWLLWLHRLHSLIAWWARTDADVLRLVQQRWFLRERLLSISMAWLHGHFFRTRVLWSWAVTVLLCLLWCQWDKVPPPLRWGSLQLCMHLYLFFGVLDVDWYLSVWHDLFHCLGQWFVWENILDFVSCPGTPIAYLKRVVELFGIFVAIVFCLDLTCGLQKLFVISQWSRRIDGHFVRCVFESEQ